MKNLPLILPTDPPASTPLSSFHIPSLQESPCASAHRGLLSVPCEPLVTPSRAQEGRWLSQSSAWQFLKVAPRSAASHQPVYTPCHSAQSLQSCPTLCFSVHGILQARILEWVAIPSSRGSSWSRDQTCVSFVSFTAGEFFTAELLGKPLTN